MNLAAKYDAKSGYNTLPGLYCVFTEVNRKTAMNTHHANTLGLSASPDTHQAATRCLFWYYTSKTCGTVQWYPGLRAVLLSHGAR